MWLENLVSHEKELRHEELLGGYPKEWEEFLDKFDSVEEALQELMKSTQKSDKYNRGFSV